MSRALLCLLPLLLAAPSSARIKIDGYEASTLPEMKLWISLLQETQPTPPGIIRAFSVYLNGETVRGIEQETAQERGEPMAVAAILDARFPERWVQSRIGLGKALQLLPEGSLAFAVAAHEGFARLPEEGWSSKPSVLAASFQEIEAGGQDPRLLRGLRKALSAFPLREGLEPGAADGPLPSQGEKDPEIPKDRLLYVVGDGVLELNEEQGESESLRDLVYLARRRGVRIMAIGVHDEESLALWRLRILSRKTGGTFRHASRPSDIPALFEESAAELAGRFVLTFEAETLRRGDIVNFRVKAALTDGSREESREFSARVGNVLSFWERVGDWISDLWEKLPWWGRWLLIGGLGLLFTGILFLLLWRRAKKRRAAQQAAEKKRRAALAKRRPCPVCGKVMMPNWKECYFCDRP